jgi:hypothetical protein
VREITVSGSPRRMSEEHGEAARDLIAELFATRFELIMGQMAAAVGGRPASDGAVAVESWTRTIAGEIAARLPDVATELEGVGRGSGLAPWELVVAGGYTDVLGGVLTPEDPRTPCECTVMAVRGTGGGGAVIAGTWDSHASASPALVLLRRQPASGVPTLSLTTAGWPAQQGVNAAGLAFATTNLRPRRGGPGVAYIGALAQLLDTRSIDDARGLLLGLRYCSGHYYPIADEHGRLLLVETCNDITAELASDRPVVTHTNHYLARELEDENPRDDLLQNSVERLRRAEAMVASSSAESVRRQLWTVLGDHGTAGTDVCRHGEGHETRSCAAFVIDAERRSIEFTDGPACSGVRRTVLL